MADKLRVDPYGFVPLGPNPPVRERPVGHDRFSDGALHGELQCRLTAMTPLFVYDARSAKRLPNGHEEARFPVVDKDEALIPGSSLKGVIRSLFEAIEPSCFVLPNDWKGGRRTYRGSGITRGRDVTVQIPRGFAPCTDLDELCAACRVFGAVLPRGGQDEERAWAGQVSIRDARAPHGQYTLLAFRTLGVLSAPKPEARPAAYLAQPGNVVKGRKFYRHRLDPIERSDRRDRQTKTVQMVDRGAVFRFAVEYENLREAELRTLLYAVALEPGLWHKVGMGKPLGLGSAHIEIERWTRRDPATRYRGRGSGLEVIEGELLTQELETWLRPYRATEGRSDEPANLKAVRGILRHDHGFDVRYPGPDRRGRDR